MQGQYSVFRHNGFSTNVHQLFNAFANKEDKEKNYQKKNTNQQVKSSSSIHLSRKDIAYV